MKLSALFICLCCMSIFANAYSQNISLDTGSGGKTVLELLNDIEKQTQYRFFYNSKFVDLDKIVQKSFQNKNIDEVLSAILDKTSVSYKILDGNFIIITPVSLMQQGITVIGTVTDQNGEAMPGVNVVIKGTTTGVVTDVNGKYSIAVPDKNAVLVFSFVGSAGQEIQVDGRQQVNVTMTEEAKELDEVVVVGYGTSRKREIVGAVASVKSGVISNASTNSINDVLQGKIAGVDFTSERYPGDNQGITIRGVRSLNASNDPLVIIDGVPGSLSNVSTYDIESVEILKDAASSAIYGSRAANGVILVTTKRAKAGVKSEVNFNAFYGINVPYMVSLMQGEKFAQFRRDMYRYSNGWDKPFTDENVFTPSELEIVRSGNYVDWQDLLYRNAASQSYYLSLSNAINKTKIYTSFKYDDNQGYYKTNSRKNYNLNITVDQEVTKFWNMQATVRWRKLENNGFQTYDRGLMYMTPLSKPYHNDGSMNYFPNEQNSSGFNPLANYVPGQFVEKDQWNYVNINAASILKFTDYLSMTTNFGYSFDDRKLGKFYGKYSYNGKGVKSQAGMEYENSYDYILNNIISYSQNFGRHNLSVDLVGEIQSHKWDKAALYGDDQTVDYTTYYNMASATDNVRIGSEYRDWKLASVLARARYNFKNKYLLNVAIRTDGSSRLAPGNQWEYFPSGGIAWSMKDEDFMQNAHWLSSLKPRISYGTVGNTAISEYQTKAPLSQYYYLFGEGNTDKFSVYRPSSLANYDLGWEISRTLNAGVDFGIFNNMLAGYVEWYQTRTSDLLMERAIPPFTGFTRIWQNIGKTQNDGVEINLTATPVRQNDFKLEFVFNFSRNWQKIVSLISGEDLPNNKWFIGKPFRVEYDYEKIGIWQLGEEADAAVYNAVPGTIRIKDQDGDGFIKAADDKVILGQTIPKVLASFGIAAQYKDFDLSVNLNSKWGYVIHPSPFYDFVGDGSRWVPDVSYWTPDNPTNDYQKADRTGAYDPNAGTNGYMNANHIKLQDITLGYSFKGILSKQNFVKSARLYVQMRNIGYLYRAAPVDIRPEALNFEYTIPNSYNFGLNVTF